MGQNDNSPILYMDGNPIAKIASMPEVTSAESTEERYILGIDLAKCYDFTASVKLPHMSRKSFVSKLMKLGYSKKEAKKIAWGVHKEKHCYASTYAIYTIGRFGLN